MIRASLVRASLWLLHSHAQLPPAEITGRVPGKQGIRAHKGLTCCHALSQIYKCSFCHHVYL